MFSQKVFPSSEHFTQVLLTMLATFRNSMDSGMGCTGELWLNTNFLNGKSIENSILIYDKNQIALYFYWFCKKKDKIIGFRYFLDFQDFFVAVVFFFKGFFLSVLDNFFVDKKNLVASIHQKCPKWTKNRI